MMRTLEMMMSKATKKPAPFQHHMLKEIFEQPHAVMETILAIDAPAAETSPHQRIPWEKIDLRKLDKIFIAASGTSRHAGMAGKTMIEALAGIPTEVDYSSEYQYAANVLGPNVLMMVITQSGETADTLAALRKARKHGASVMAICNVAGASILREADIGIHTKAGPELAVPSTKAFTAQLVALFLFALRLAEARGAVSHGEAQNLMAEVMALPEKIKEALTSQSRCQELAQRFLSCEDFVFCGRGVHYPIALDGALKLKEVAYLHAEGFPLGEVPHGPMAMLDEKFVVVVLATCDRRDSESVLRYMKTLGSLQEIQRRKANIIAIANAGDESILAYTEHVVWIPTASDLLLPLLEIAPLQLLAYHIAVLLGRDVDRPRNLAKAVTTE